MHSFRRVSLSSILGPLVALGLLGPQACGGTASPPQNEHGLAPVATDSTGALMPVAGGRMGSSLGTAAGGIAIAASPMSLTASDGTGLRLVALVGEASIEGPLALTELHLTFENPEDRVLEGQFRITLPVGASISRFAMRQNKNFQEAEVVEKQAARRAYEDFLHRKQDPALLEQGAGNEFSARVFPIPAHGTKEVVITYSQLLTTRAGYTLPLLGLPQVDLLRIRAFERDAQSALADITETNFTPKRDLHVNIKGIAANAAVRAGNLLMMRVVPMTTDAPEPMRSAVFLVDTSASRALGLADQVAKLEALLAQLPGSLPIVVNAFDQSSETVFEGPAAAWSKNDAAKILARGALGASNLESALEAAGAAARRIKGGNVRVVLLGDGVATAGETDAGKLHAKAATLAAAGVTRLDALSFGGIRDEAMLRTLARGALAKDGIVLDASADATEIVRRLNSQTKSQIPVRVAGAEWSYPTMIDGAQAGDESFIFARVTAQGSPTLTVGDARITPDVTTVPAPLLVRAAALAEIESLEKRLGEKDLSADKRDALDKMIINLSMEHRVLSSRTAMLVLETDSDFARFGISRNSTFDILRVSAGQVGIERASRIAIPMANNDDSTARRDHSKNDKAGQSQPAAKSAPNSQANATTEMSANDESSERPPMGRTRSQGRPVDEESNASKAAGVQDAVAHDVGVPEPRMESPARSAMPEQAAPPEPRSAAHGAGRMADLSTRMGGSHGGIAPTPSAASGYSASAPVVRMGELRRRADDEGEERDQRDQRDQREEKSAYTGRFLTVMTMLKAGRVKDAKAEAIAWRLDSPGDEMALVALGEVAEAMGNKLLAERAYGSILELFSFRADSRRFAGERLERVGTNSALAVDAYRGAVAQRPDHPASHRLLAFTLAKLGRYREAFAAIEEGAKRKYPEGRFRGVARILREDAGLLGAAWAKAEPARLSEINGRLAAIGASLDRMPSLRFVLNWETDANDVDFHIRDAKGNHAYYSDPHLISGGDLYADVTTGYGPECFTIRGPAAARTYPYTLQAHYYSRGPMGYGMGKLEVIDFDGAGGLHFDERPFVVMTDQAFIDLGTVQGPLK